MLSATEQVCEERISYVLMQIHSLTANLCVMYMLHGYRKGEATVEVEFLFIIYALREETSALCSRIAFVREGALRCIQLVGGNVNHFWK